MNNKIFNAYAAGFFDGEGNVAIASTTSHLKCNPICLALRVIIGQKDVAPLLKIKKKWGGSIYHDKYGIYFWRCQSKMAERFLKDLFPYLIVKKKHAKIGLKFRESFRGHPGGRYKIGITKSILKLRIKQKEQIHLLNNKVGFALRKETKSCVVNT